MNFFTYWEKKNSLHINVNNIMCCTENDILINRHILNYLSSHNVPDNWDIISLYEPNNFTNNQIKYFEITQINNTYGFFIRSPIIKKINNLVKSGMSKLDAINQIIKIGKLKCYSFRIPIIYPKNMSNSINYYEYFYQENIWKYMIEYCKNFIKDNISIRHQLSELPRFNSIQTLIHIFDLKLGMDPYIVNELITLSSLSDLSKLFNDKNKNIKIIDEYLEKYIKKYPKFLDYFDKNILNYFFDKYIYEELPMFVIIPSYNNDKNYEKNLTSVFNQKYSNWRIVYIDDMSVDNTYNNVKKFMMDYNLYNKFTLLQNKTHNAQCATRYIGYMMADDDEIVCNLDGDDFLYNRDDQYKYMALHYVESGY